MKFYSEDLKKLFDSEKELQDAEVAAKNEKLKAVMKEKALKEARKTRAKAVDDARDAAIKARHDYQKLLNEFVKDYGSYHSTYSSDNMSLVEDLFDCLFGA